MKHVEVNAKNMNIITVRNAQRLVSNARKLVKKLRKMKSIKGKVLYQEELSWYNTFYD
ncbi:hypothetical protein SOJ_26750 [Staphylococcus sp. OJ82]|nr:hypothetical protein SOJ_26750 [Staphylococcus sp. OJ82]